MNFKLFLQPTLLGYLLCVKSYGISKQQINLLNNLQLQIEKVFQGKAIMEQTIVPSGEVGQLCVLFSFRDHLD